MTAFTKLRPGQKRRFNPHLPRVVRERAMQRKELEKREGPMIQAQREISGDLKRLSGMHKEHAQALGEVAKISTEQQARLREAMKDPRYTGMRAEGVDHDYVAWVTSEFEKIYPEGKQPQDRDLNPSTGHPLHWDGGE